MIRIARNLSQTPFCKPIHSFGILHEDQNLVFGIT